MTINDKIKQILIEQNFTPSYFADEIGIQRSSISHILSGRNRPSFDVIQKIIRRFPELGYEWIMEEETQPVNKPSLNNGNSQGNMRPPHFNQPVYPQQPPVQQTGSLRNQRVEIAPLPIPQLETPSSPVIDLTQPIHTRDNSANIMGSGLAKKAERIIVFYTDGSFQEYTPSS